MKILVVDDDLLILESCRRILEGGKHKVITVSSADRALEVLARETCVKLVITDIKMPGKDGLFLVKEIQDLYPGMPVLIMTGYLMDEVKQMGRQEGHRWFLAKPFTPDELVRGMEKALGTSL